MEEELQQYMEDFTAMSEFGLQAFLSGQPELAELAAGILMHGELDPGERVAVDSIETDYAMPYGVLRPGVTITGHLRGGRKEPKIVVRLVAGDMSPHELHFQSSLLDASLLGPGFDESALPDAYLISVAGRGPCSDEEDAVHHLVWRDETESGKGIVELDMGNYILLVNADWRGPDALGDLMHDFHCANPEEMYIRQMAERMRYLKDTEDGRKELAVLARSVRGAG